METATDLPSECESEEAPVSVELLLFFTAVAEERSFTKAARRLGIDQSWLSQKIRQLETLLACTLFVRTTRRIELTAAGEALLRPAQTLAQVTREARRAAFAISKGVRALHIGAYPFSFFNPERVKLIDRFIHDHPETEVKVSNGTSPMLIERLRQGEINLAFLSWPFDPAGLEMLPVRLDRYCMLVPKEHRLAAAAEITLADIAGERMAMPNRRHNPQTYASVYDPLVAAGAIPATVPEFQHDATFRFARRHRLPMLCNVMEVDGLGADDFIARPIAGHQMSNRKYLVRRRGDLTPAIEAFWKMAATICQVRFDTTEAV